MKKIIILGCGGHAKSVLDTIELLGEYEICGFVDMPEKASFQYRGYKVIGCDDDLQRMYDSGIQYAFIGIGFMGHGTKRNKMYEQLKYIGYRLPSVIDPTAVLAKDVCVGEGTFISKKTVVNANSIIGKMAIVNTGAVIEHDCLIGDFSHVSVSAVVCGAAHIGDNVFLGANSTIFQEINVGNGALVGAGSIVNRDIDENIKYISKSIFISVPKEERE